MEAELREAGEHKSRILIVDDHAVLREGLALLVNKEEDLTVCGNAEDANQALEAIEESRPDLVIVDITLKHSNGIGLIKEITIRHPKLRVLVLSMHEDSLYAERAIQAGANGYITKRETGGKVLTAIRQVLSGEVYIGDEMLPELLRGLADGEPH